jgi:hypothetical protein
MPAVRVDPLALVAVVANGHPGAVPVPRALVPARGRAPFSVAAPAGDREVAGRAPSRHSGRRPDRSLARAQPGVQGTMVY